MPMPDLVAGVELRVSSDGEPALIARDSENQTVWQAPYAKQGGE